MPTAKFWHPVKADRVACELCPHLCIIGEGRSGRCAIRLVADGALQARGYGLLSGMHSDPIEKKPLYHYHPGGEIFSIGGWGCNFACAFCQNWNISQQIDWQARRYSPQEIIALAQQAGSFGIAYTYNEPLINIEFIYDCATLAQRAGLANILVTNGYLEEKPAAWILPLIGALNIDIKSMDDAFYRQQCQGTLAPVLRFACQARAAGCHVEITNLLIPGLNDAPAQLSRLAGWILEQLGPSTPLHLSAYHPDYKLRLPRTPLAALLAAHEICRRDLHYVYLGNVSSGTGQDTHCPQCKARLIQREGYRTQVLGIQDKACAQCGRPADVVL